MLSVDGFNELNWRSQCDLLAEQSSKGCGLSHTVFVDKFSSAVDSALFQLSPDERIPLLEIAREWDYATPQERHDEQIDCVQNGYCSHGIEFGCCPAGCEEPPSLADEYLQDIHDLKDKLGVAEDIINDLNEQLDDLIEPISLRDIESLEIEIHALEHEVNEANRRLENMKEEVRSARSDMFQAQYSEEEAMLKLDFYQKHPIKAFFSLFLQNIKK
jgi:hypothetical protein